MPAPESSGFYSASEARARLGVDEAYFNAVYGQLLRYIQEGTGRSLFDRSYIDGLGDLLKIGASHDYLQPDPVVTRLWNMRHRYYVLAPKSNPHKAAYQAEIDRLCQKLLKNTTYPAITIGSFASKVGLLLGVMHRAADTEVELDPSKIVAVEVATRHYMSRAYANHLYELLASASSVGPMVVLDALFRQRRKPASDATPDDRSIA